MGPLKGVRYDGWLTLEDGEGTWWEGYDPQQLYNVPDSEEYKNDKEYMSIGETPPDSYKENWYLRTKELIDNYQPDLVWFDGPMPMRLHEETDPADKKRFEQVGLDITSYYYNQSLAWDGEEAIVNIKSWGPGTVVDSSAVVMDIEKGLLTRINPYYWQAETSIGSWFYNGTSGVELPTQVIVHNLLDVVSKNGNMLLNVGLKPDGTLLPNERQALREIGDWLTVHGEGVYGTRAWTVFGEVDTELVSGDFQQNKRPMTARDIRYTQKGDDLYAFFMDQPADAMISLASVNEQTFGPVGEIRLLSEDRTLDWEHTDAGLQIQLPAQMDYQHAYALKITPKQAP